MRLAARDASAIGPDASTVVAGGANKRPSVCRNASLIAHSAKPSQTGRSVDQQRSADLAVIASVLSSHCCDGCEVSTG